MLIRRAEVWQHGLADLRISIGRIAAIGQLVPEPGETIIEANGGALLPGLHDHHIHLTASAARAASVICGPPQVTSAQDLASVLSAPGEGWLRGILYHESVMGLPDVAALDEFAPHRPVRIQHRSGRMWLLNSRALDLLLAAAAPPAGMECSDGRFTGRLFDEDTWLQGAMASQPPSLADVSAELARYGVTGVTDMSPRNDPVIAGYFAEQVASGALLQHCTLAGMLALADAPASLHWQLGPAKLHLHESALPDFDQTVNFIGAAHAQGRGLASHCTTETELVFTLAAIEAAGALRGDRIEHAGIARDDHIAMIAAMGLAVVSQPHFIAERGDQYLAEVEPELHPALYRLASFINSGVPLAAGSDAPFGSLDPWNAMAAAVSRQTTSGEIVRKDEALSPEQALELYLADPADISRQRTIALGEPADLCLLSCPWSEAHEGLTSTQVAATIVSGKTIHNRIDQPPVQRFPR